ncbi:probable uridine nucleosidase 1 [Panicum hallii]|uniref:probable uridine nucleosidase 1 n=1 Tax=Panicum hallii TaxID=206008 RepID=UPI000DF4E650|nr:probable uridine nucleosidase 1 [Panicum hallii]
MEAAANGRHIHHEQLRREKLIIDTDPGVGAYLCEKAGHPEIPVAKGSSEPLKGGKPHVADFVHGSDGLGNIELPDPSIKKVEQRADESLVDKVSQFPGEVSVLALGPLTNVALAIKRDPSFVKNVKEDCCARWSFLRGRKRHPCS